MDAKQAKLQIETYKPFFDRLINQDVILSFGRNVLPMHLIGVEYAKLGELHNAPDKRSNGDKNYTPPIMSIVFRNDDDVNDPTTMDIAIEDIEQLRYTFKGCAFHVGDVEYKLELAQ